MKIGVRGIGVIIFYKFLSVPGVTRDDVVTIWRCRWHVVNMRHDVFFFFFSVEFLDLFVFNVSFVL